MSVLADEKQLKSLGFPQSGIDQLTISTTRSNILLGSGDATLIVDEGTVEKDTVVRSAVFLHGPFVYLDGYKPASAVVYLNFERATPPKQIKLMLRHWWKRSKIIGETVLKLLRAPLTIGKRQNCYTFHEVHGTSSADSATFPITEPQGLYCVGMKMESQAVYNAIAFQQDLSDKNMVKFKIQFMYDSLEWNKVSTCTALRGKRHSTLHVSVAAMFAAADKVPEGKRMEE